MLIAVAPLVQHALTLQENLIRLHTGLHGPRTEVPELLALRLAGTNCCAQVHNAKASPTGGKPSYCSAIYCIYIYIL